MLFHISVSVAQQIEIIAWLACGFSLIKHSLFVASWMSNTLSIRSD